jgi:glutamate dehydrogenase
MNLIEATLRTNYFQAGEDGGRKPYLALKFDSRHIDGLPRPVPWCETYVYSPRTEAIHLRGGQVARGGIRWSERRDDFRTEALGLLKAQMVKNAAIVPVGAKGCFLVKRPPAGGSAGAVASGPREAFIQEGIECYRILLRGLLDLTDNVTGGQVVPPPRVVRYDGDDPYLVVAADKGTVTFSDIANALAAEYGFWIGDSFASGGSAGYDHKRMGITARGVWEAVKRHCREMGKDVEREAFTAVGIGDMSGDVFGNGMLLSSHLRLVGAFNHLHIFIDPDPDPAASYDERRRLFELPRSSWADYSPQRLSPGGGVFERNAKAIPVSPEMAARFGLTGPWASPDELIRHVLRAEVDLLWLGGIGTYVKAQDELHADVGDRSNDALRVDACELRCRVVGEGANIGFTQRGRVEFALGGGRINTDFIDNCAGVACSDREVNLKLALEDALSRGRLTRQDRNPLLARLTDEVAALVLRDSYLQTQGISLEQRAGDLDRHAWLLRRLEKAGRLDRRLEALPDFEEMENRRRSGIGLTRPEIAILVNAAKIALQDDLLASDLPDDPGLAADLLDYFPRLIEERHRESIEAHRLRREIVAAVLANRVVDRMGPAFALGLAEEAGVTTAEVVRAYVNGREVLGVRALWTAIEALDLQVAAPVQLQMMLELRRLLEPAALWFLRSRRRRLSVAAWVARLRPGVEALLAALPAVLSAADRTAFEERCAGYTAEGVPEELAASVAAAEPLASACDLVELAQELDLGIEPLARTYFAVGARYQLPSLRRAAAAGGDDAWQKSAGQALIHDLFRCQLTLAGHALRAGGPDRQDAGEGPLDRVLAELQTRPRPDLAMLTVAVRHLRDLAGL